MTTDYLARINALVDKYNIPLEEQGSFKLDCLGLVKAAYQDCQDLIVSR